MKNRALIRVSDTVKIADFSKQLEDLGYDIVCSKSNSEILAAGGIAHSVIKNETFITERLDNITEGMQSSICAAILTDRSNREQMTALIEKNIEPIDIVCVNINEYDSLNDISAVSLIKTAVSNLNDVTVVVDYLDYDTVISEIREKGEVSKNTRLSLGVKAMEYVVHNEVLFTDMLRKRVNGELFPKYMNFTYEKVNNLKCGENINQSAAFYKEINNIEPTIPNLKRLKGENLEFYDIVKINSAVELIREFDETATVVMGDIMPLGIGIGETVYESYINAVRYDFSSVVGAVAITNSSVDRKTALEILKTGYAAFIAPDYDEDAFELLSQKENINLYEIKDNKKCVELRRFDMRTISGGALIQAVNNKRIAENDVICSTTRVPTKQQMSDMLLAIRVAKHLKTNCCVAASNGRVLGLGSGEKEISIALKLAVEADRNEYDNMVVGFDGIIDSTQIIEIAAENKISAIIQSGGSEIDDEITNLCNEKGIIMVLTNTVYNKG